MRHVGLAALMAGAVLCGGGAMAQTVGAPTIESARAMSDAERIEAFDSYLQASVQNAAFSGTVLVAKDGVPIFRRSYGMASVELGVPNTGETVFQLQSITKTFTALLVMMLEEEGRLRITDRACDYLDDCPDAWREVTIQQLLSHTSGIEGYSRLDDWDETLDSRTYWHGSAARLVRDRPLTFAPGEGYRYSNTGYILLAWIAERVAGMTLAELYQERILDPAGMTHTRFDTSRRIIPGGATGYYSLGSTFIAATPQSPTSGYGESGLSSTVDDLLAWDQAVHGHRLVSRTTLERMVAPVSNNYGLGWELRDWAGRRAVTHAGSGHGFSTIVARFVEDGLTVIVLSNSDAANAGGTVRDLASIYFGTPYRMPTLGRGAQFLDAVQAGGVEAGIARYREMKGAEPEHAAFQTDELLVSAGYDLFGLPDMDLARGVFAFALQEFPRSAYAHDGLADIALAEGDVATAIREFEVSLGIDPENEYAVKGLARARGEMR